MTANELARKAAIRRLARAYDRWAWEEEFHRSEGREIEAVAAHAYGVWCLRAYVAELDNPTPEGL